MDYSKELSREELEKIHYHLKETLSFYKWDSCENHFRIEEVEDLIKKVEEIKIKKRK